ncbi:MAG: hypothetical protein QGF23_01610 [Dehalococcoidales bacterium]|jgi:hypothetical protein|nr:hypothetical protein [Dehalococcoidales bacterium]
MQNAAFIVIGLGTLVLVGWGGKGFFATDEIPLFYRIVVGAIAVAVVVLLGIVIRDRIAQAKKDNFKEVDK